MEYVVGVDIGGTFTDVVVVDEQGRVTLGKAPSTPQDFSEGVIAAVRDAAENMGLSSEEQLVRSTRLFIHACTVGENALITRTGAKTGLVATAGFGDTFLMMRGKVTQGLTETEAAHISALTKPESLVLKPLIAEVNERIDYKGAVLIELDPAEADKALKKLLDQKVESVAVCLLWSIANNAHEKRLEEMLQRDHPEIVVSLSSDVAPFLGEYERTATTIFNAYIGPKMASYLSNLQKALRAKGLRRELLVMQAYGGVLGVGAAAKKAVGTIESGPAAGVVGSKFLGDHIGERNILAADMGGTTFKVSVIRDGNLERDYAPVFLRHSILSPKIWVESIGSGGGSIAWIENETGLLKVGPQGAGSNPGPVCYGVGGTEPTVSDADLVLGYLNPDYFLGGRMRLHLEAAREAIRQKIAQPLGMREVEAARGIWEIANAHMSDLIRRATVERGYDPRSFVLFAFGGAGPVHASRYARELGIKKVVIPFTASVHGATGLVSSDVVYQYGKSDHLVLPADIKRVNANFAELCAKGVADLRAAGFDGSTQTIIRGIDMRYRFQVHELNVPLPPGTAELTDKDMELLNQRFDQLYEESYGRGSGYAEAGREIITFRVDAIGTLPKPQFRKEALGNQDPRSAQKDRREVYFEEHRGFVPTDIYDFSRITPGMEVPGPAIIETPVTTIVLQPRDRARVDELRNVEISMPA